MTIRTRVSVVAALAMLGATVPAFAQDVPADANKALWCASAFTLVEPQARAQGQAAAADNFLTYSKKLSQTSHDSLSKAGFTEDQIKTQGTTYADKVGKELAGGGPAAEFSVVDCTMLVDPAAAAAIQQPPAAPAAGAAAPAPDAAAPAAPAPAPAK